MVEESKCVIIKSIIELYSSKEFNLTSARKVGLFDEKRNG
jgi:hypothetical protein